MPNNWKDLLQRAVSPLEEGARALNVNDYREDPLNPCRPGRTAAVLVPILDLDEPAIVLTRRSEHLKHHAGQVSFPGGAAEHHDDSGVYTALRESWEEIGLEPGLVKPLGFLDRFDSISDYRVLPVVGLVSGDVEWRIDTSEVAEVFTVPLEVVLDRERYKLKDVSHNGRDYQVFSLSWQGRLIWGLTAAMLQNLRYRMKRAG